MGDYRKLEVWQLSHALVLDIYKVTSSYPNHEMFGLTSQTRRAAISIAANIVEGCGRGRDGEMSRFLIISLGSATELEYHLLVAKDVGYLPNTEYDRLSECLSRILRMLNTFTQRVRNSFEASNKKIAAR
ncbi:MAG: four helix bundle protein [Candidatus Zixiibacteriota bacterium]|nr:MAG: four helix bundle protein [candidate division Zixibacteria bacterium]